MKTLDPRDIQLALLPKETLTFANVIQKLESDAGLSDLRKRDLISGLAGFPRRSAVRPRR